MYFSIDANVKNNNITGLHYDIARTVRIVIIFDPIEPINDEDLVREEIPTNEQLEDPDLNPSDFYRKSTSELTRVTIEELEAESDSDSETESDSESTVDVTSLHRKHHKHWGIIGELVSTNHH